MAIAVSSHRSPSFSFAEMSSGPGPVAAMSINPAAASSAAFASQGPSGLQTPTGPGGSQLFQGAPVAANSLGNKPAIAGSSLYQACLALRERLWCVQDFGETFLEPTSTVESPSDPQPSGSSTSLSSLDTRGRFASQDPVTQLWQCFRLGAPLCWLYNRLQPDAPLPLSQEATRTNANECKKQVAKFIMALQHKLGWDPDHIFTVSQLYLNDTNGFVKVVQTISMLLDVFEARGLLVQAPQSALNDEMEKPTDDRMWIVRELLNTERKYVQDLEVLQSYARALAQYDIIPTDTIHSLFGNLNTLVDVQRRFLICIEENARRPVDEQHFGHVFRTMEADFAVYEPFCANYAQALDIINAESQNLTVLQGIPAAQGFYLEPSYELPTFLIKPVQRICKYPLLLDSLLKKTAPEAQFYSELADGLDCIRRITDKVNETRRLQENIQIVRDLQQRVEDWKGHNIATFGNLLLSDVFMVSKSETEREYHVYLFEKILLCCKELQPNSSKKSSKSNSLLKQKPSTAPTPPGKKPRSILQLKGRIFINNVTSAITNSKAGALLGSASGGAHALHVWWRGDLDQESFSLRCKNDEQLKQWQSTINRLIEEVTLRKQQLAAQYGHTGAISPGTQINMSNLYAAASGRRSGSISQAGHSLFPQTPGQEVPPGFPFKRTHSQSSAPYPDEDTLAPYAAGGGLSGRGTPLGSRYSQPAEQRDRPGAPSDTRPRARTEDQEGSTLTQWRSHSPAMLPPLPRNGSSSGGDGQGLPTLQQLRKTSSSKQLRKDSSASSHAFPRPPARGQEGQADVNGVTDQMGGLLSPATAGGAPVPVRGDSMPTSRQRATSNPAAPNVPNFQQLHHHQPMPPMPQGHRRASPSADGAMSGSILPNGKSHRFSSSSISSMDSKRSSRSRPGSTAASSPIALSAGGYGGAGSFAGNGKNGHASRTHNGHGSNGSTSSSAHHHSGSMGPPPIVPPGGVSSSKQISPTSQAPNAVKLIVHHGDDKLAVMVLPNVTLADLVEKVSRKLRHITGRKAESLKIRYVDEDGDRVLMHDDDDVQMAFETSRGLGTDVDLIVS